MDLQDILWLSYKDLRDKRVRTALTVLMVMIGVAAIVALTSFTAGINQSISSSLEALGPTSIIVSSASSTGFTSADVGRIATLPNVTSVTPVLTGSGYFYAGNQNISVTLVGVTSQGMIQLLGGNLTLYQGTSFQDTIAPDAVVGHSVAFPSSAAGQQTIIVGQSASLRLAGRGAQTVTVPIVGILQSHGGFIIPIDTSVFVPLSAAEVLLHKNSFNEMLVLASNISSVNATASLITDVYGSGARVLTVSQLLSTVATVIGGISLLFGVIAGVSLLVAAVGIMNIMLMSVMERTHEIGIMKAIGFKDKHVLLVFMLQALIIGVFGGILGIGVGAGVSYSLSAAFGSGSGGAAPTQSSSGPATSRTGGGVVVSGRAGGGNQQFAGGQSSSGSSGLTFSPAFPISTILSAFIIAIIVSIVAGLYPAWRASKMQPIDALREL
ncbi:MAG: ABC transporter permease [Candidatus Marsarchaeota archaeon]|nr:ABC transporter permease [Candidatus Marsarchaeota archaeon]